MLVGRSDYTICRRDRSKREIAHGWLDPADVSKRRSGFPTQREALCILGTDVAGHIPRRGIRELDPPAGNS